MESKEIKEPFIVKRYADNGALSHWEVIEKSTHEKLFDLPVNYDNHPLEQYAEQEAIVFAEWCDNDYSRSIVDGKWRDARENYHTTSELYTIFKTSKPTNDNE